MKEAEFAVETSPNYLEAEKGANENPSVAFQVLPTQGQDAVRDLIEVLRRYNTLKNEYPQFGGHYEVQHHSALLAQLVEAGRLSNSASNGDPITLHDPCERLRCIA